jgi:vancomycin resistance protein VanJ
LTFLCRLSQGMLWFGALWLLLWNVFLWWPGEQCWAVAVVNYFTPWVSLALLPLIALTWLFRQRLLSLTLLAAAVLMGVHLVPLFVFKPSVPASGQPLKVMTFNVHQRNTDAMTIVDVILKEDADVIALQELTPSVSEHLAQTLEKRYPYHTLRSEHLTEGQGLLSRYPLEQLSAGPDYRFQSAVVQTPGGPVTLLNIHTPSLFPIGWRRDWEQQRDFLQGVITQFSEIEGPLLVVGDFNTTPQSENYALLRRHLRDAFLDSGWGFGFSYPAIPKFGIRLPWPLVRIDYIFHNNYLVSHETRVLRDGGGSDHRPVVSVLSLLGER